MSWGIVCPFESDYKKVVASAIASGCEMSKLGDLVVDGAFQVVDVLGCPVGDELGLHWCSESVTLKT